MARLTSRRASALLLVAGLGAAACGEAAEVLEPRVALREAMSSVSTGPARFTVSVEGSEADMATLFNSGERPTDEDRLGFKVLADSKLVIAGDKGDDAESCADDRSALDVQIGGVDRSVQMVASGKVLYLRADVDALTELFDVPRQTIDAFVGQAKAAGFDFVEEAIDGRWLRTDLGAIEATFQEMAGPAGQDGPESQLFDCEVSQQFASAFGSVFTEDVSVERKGRDGAGERYLVRMPLRKAYENLLRVLASLPDMGEMAAGLPPVTEVPDEDLLVDVWVKDGRIRRGEVDLRQVARMAGEAVPSEAGRVALRVDIDSTDVTVDVPEDAVEVDLLAVFGQFMGMMGGYGNPNFD